MEITHIVKRDSETSLFELDKITKAIEKAMLSVNNGTLQDAIAITNIVNGTLLERKLNEPGYTPTVLRWGGSLLIATIHSKERV